MRNKGPSIKNPSSCEAEFLTGGPYIKAAQSLLAAGTRGEDTIYVRAYSFDCPVCVEGIETSLAKGAGVRVIADASQCQRTKLQRQVLKRLSAAGAEVRVACGTSVRDAYAQDGRGARVGSGIQGLHHSKALCLLRPDGAVMLVGSLNFTTSSKANSETGLRLETAKAHPATVSFVEEFQRVAAAALDLNEAAARRPQLERASSSGNHAVVTQSLRRFRSESSRLRPFGVAWYPPHA